MDFPVIDLAGIDNSDSQLDIAKKITEASSTWGFLLLKNHAIPADDIEKMFSLGREFFVNVPESEKIPYPINDKYVGYNGALSDRKKDDKASIWLSGKPGFLKGEGSKALPPYWHEKIDAVDDFKHKCHGLVMKLLVCFALAMGLPDRNHFAKAHDEYGGNGNQFRILRYPPRDNEPLKTITRMSPHSDSGSVTLLFQTCAGLEIESPSGEWISAPYIENHILCNLGDALALWSGGQLKATRHRVTFDTVPHNVERMSMAYFGAASPETVLEPLKIEGAKELKTYEANGVTIPAGITVGEYLKMIMAGIYGAGLHEKPSSVEAAGVVTVGA